MRVIVSVALSAVLGQVGTAAADPGDVLWFFEIPSPASPHLHRPSVGSGGMIYWAGDLLYAITPAGQEAWSRPGAEPNPVGIGADGTLYVGGWRPPPEGFKPALKAFSPSGVHLWDYTGFGEVLGFIGGPDVGPDGNVYAVTWGGANPNPSGFGAFSLTPGGSLRWHVDGFAHIIAGAMPSEIVFGGGRMYKSESFAPMPSGELQSGIVAIGLDGDIAWRHSVNIPSGSASREPCVSPLNGNVHLRLPPRAIRTYDSAGAELWTYGGAYTPLGFGAPAVGPDGSVYVVNGNRHVIALNAAGQERWIATDAVGVRAYAPEVSPDGRLLVFGTEACFDGACPGRVIGLDTADGSVVFDRALPPTPGGTPSVRTRPRFSADGSAVYIGTVSYPGLAMSALFALSTAGGCSANCDGSTAAPVLNVQDFGCFLNAFAAGQPYANCDGSTVAPVLNVADFACFLNLFAAGCP